MRKILVSLFAVIAIALFITNDVKAFGRNFNIRARRGSNVAVNIGGGAGFGYNRGFGFNRGFGYNRGFAAPLGYGYASAGFGVPMASYSMNTFALPMASYSMNVLAAPINNPCYAPVNTFSAPINNPCYAPVNTFSAPVRGCGGRAVAGFGY